MISIHDPIEKNETKIIEDYTNKICSIVYEDGYKLKDCNDEEIWTSKTSSNKSLSYALKVKTNHYAEEYKDSYNNDDPCIWVLKTVSNDNNYSYKNVAVCKSKDRLWGEINSHINQLVNTKLDYRKAKTYQGLWQDGINSIEFRELEIDNYINNIFKPEWESEESYIRSLVFPDHAPYTDQANNILKAIRAKFVEGRIAFECNMKDDGIWEPSQFDIDGAIYEYYKIRYSTS